MTAWAYWLMLIAAAALVPIDRSRFAKSGLFVFAVIAIALIGLRRDVGGDWEVYLAWVDGAIGASITDLRTDPAYDIVNWIGANWGGGIYLVNTVCAAIAVGGLVIFCAHQKRPGLAVLAAVPYLLVVVYTGYTRQSVAIGLGMLAVLAAQRQAIIWFVVLVTIAALFHKTAVCLFVFIPALCNFSLERISLYKYAGVTAYAGFLVFFLFADSIGYLLGGYLHTAQGQSASEDLGGAPELSSIGAVFRLGQLFLLSVILIVCWKWLRQHGENLGVWTIAAAAITGLLILSFSRSTIADRIGLYFIPLGMYVYNVLPALLGPKLEKIGAAGLVLVSGGALWIWLEYGTHSRQWVPYDWAVLQQ